MQTHDLVQGSPEWVAYRAQHFNASDAPAMLGVSPYKSRTQLLNERSTGLGQEVDAGTQRRFDDGHRFEALARPLAEAIIGEDLYPVVGSSGPFSASFDGLTLLEDTAFEHKSLNDELRAAFDDIETVAPEYRDAKAGTLLPLHYQAQMEQQCVVSGCSRVLFMASKWNGDTLVEERHCWYYPNAELRDRIVRGWGQFEADLAAYVPADAAPVVVAAAVESLPAVSVQVNGALAVVSNLAPFGIALRAFVDRIPKKPSTDQEFADTEAACKRLKEAEDRLQAAEDSALAGLSDVEAMRRMVADFRDLARTTRLASEKLVKQRKEQIREEEVQRGRKAFAEHFAGLTARLGGPFMPPVVHDFAGAIKGLKTLDSVRNAIDTELARAKIEASTQADRIDVNLKTIAAAGSPTLFPDKGALALKAADDLAAVIAQRLTAEQKRQDDERERIRKEEADRLEREAADKAAREKADQERNATTEGQDSQLVLKAEPARADATDRETPAIASPRVGAMGVGQAADAAAAGARPPINLGEIARRLGFALPRSFIEGELGVPPCAVRAAAVYWRESDWPVICAALVRRVQRAAAAATLPEDALA